MTVRGVWLLVPFLFIRFGLLAVINREAVKRAAYFAPMKPNERWIYWLYQLSTAALLVSLCFLKILVSFSWLFYISVVLYFIGLALCAAAVVNFAAPSQEGLHTNGVYRYSRIFGIRRNGYCIYLCLSWNYLGRGALVYGRVCGGLSAVYATGKAVYLATARNYHKV